MTLATAYIVSSRDKKSGRMEKSIKANGVKTHRWKDIIGTT